MEIPVLMLLFKLIILLSMRGVLAQKLPDYKNDPRCTQMKFVIRHWPEYQINMAYAVPNNSSTDPENLGDVLLNPRIYDESLKKCITKVDYLCLEDDECGTGTQCKQFQPEFYGNSSDEEQLDPAKYPIAGFCSCLEGTVKNPSGNVCSVGAKFGAPCSQSTPCIGNMECEKNKCTCPPTRALSRVNTKDDAKEVYYYGISTYKPYNGSSKDVTEFPRRFDQSTQRCVVQSGNPCDISANECPENQACTTFSNYEFGTYEGNQYDHTSSSYSLLGKCGCFLSDGNYVLDPTTNICVEQPKYGELCSDVLKCWPNDLSCNSGRCSCPKEDGIYDSERQKCRAPINSTCRYSEDCIRHASCEYLKGSGSCQCDTGYNSRNGTCIGGHLTQCKVQTDCDKGLSCIDGYCKCGNVVTQIYDRYESKCQGLVGSECSVNGIGAPKCIHSAGCKSGVCQCRPGSLVTPGKQCEYFRGLGSSCSANECNYRYGWACIDNKCKCIDQKLKISNGKCVSSVGSYCGYVEPVGKKGSSEYQNYYFIGCENDGICDAAPKAVSICKPGYTG